MEKFVVVNPFAAGFTNVQMSYEIAFAVAHITGRSIVLPPTSWCVLIDEKDSPKETWQDIWQICDREKANQEFKVYDLLEFEELAPYIDKNSPGYSWFSDDVLPNSRTIPSFADSPICLHSEPTDMQDFLKFVGDRPLCNMECTEKFLLVSGFGNYWANVYANGISDRNEMKKRVNAAFQYQSKFYELASSMITGTYNAIHVRNPKQLMFDQYADVVSFVDRPDLLLQQVKKFYPTQTPLYVATDIPHRGLFEKLASEYQLIFYDDLFQTPFHPLEKIAIDQIICSRAELFYGSYYSTFSKRINIMRGLEGRQSNDNMGFNKIMDQSPNPESWLWYADASPQWTIGI